MGRPILFTDDDKLEVMTIVCERIATSNTSIKKILNEDENLPSLTEYYRWLNEPGELSLRLRDLYARAKEDQADYLAEEILEIADDSSQDLERIDDYGNRIENKEFVNRSRLRVDARKWVAAKLKPRKYGDRVEIDGKIETEQSFSPEQYSAILQAAKDNNKNSC